MRNAHKRTAGRRRPAEPTSPSPPQTPTTSSPTTGRKAPPHDDRMASKQSPTAPRRGNPPKNLRPLGGNLFSYLRTEDLSPCSSEDSDESEDENEDAEIKDQVEEDDADDAEDEDEEDDESHNDSDESDIDESSSEEDEDDEVEDVPSPLAARLPDLPGPPTMDHTHTHAHTHISATITVVQDRLIIEDLGGEYEVNSDDDVLLPYAFEYPESEPSRPESRSRRELDPAFQRNFADLNPFEDTDDDEDDEFERNLLAKRMERRLRRMKSGSISKRTISERGSDEDREDVLPYCESTETGPLFRRTRRKTDRHSMQFSGQFPERIEELKEPNSDDEIILEGAEIFARELPFWTFMDVDSE